jgi:glycosyltransferase involved in cell wall biosynthesis
MKLSIVIPAYNEERAIAATIERSLAARETIIAGSPVDAVEVVVVSDGSTDRTAEIAAGYDAVRTIVLPTNRGYGAAIQRGFAESDGDLVSFLDADGTCDPVFFAELCTALVNEDAAIALGSRMGPQSRMPRIRRLGNRIYATLLSVLSNRVVYDTASGMRVIRRDALQKLYPLPDGLHFTPAMSARALMDDSLKIVERPMPYEDGVRFLRTILEMTLIWRPARIFMSGAAVCFLLMLLFAMHPVEMWLTLGRLEEDMIYRLLFCSLMGMVGMTLTSAWRISERLRDFADGSAGRATVTGSIGDGLFSLAGTGVSMLLAMPLLIWLVGPGVWTYVTQRQVFIHWSRVVLAGMIVFTLCEMCVTTVVLNLIRLHVERVRFARQAAVASSETAPPANTAPAKAPPQPDLVCTV